MKLHETGPGNEQAGTAKHESWMVHLEAWEFKRNDKKHADTRMAAAQVASSDGSPGLKQVVGHADVCPSVGTYVGRVWDEATYFALYKKPHPVDLEDHLIKPGVWRRGYLLDKLCFPPPAGLAEVTKQFDVGVKRAHVRVEGRAEQYAGQTEVSFDTLSSQVSSGTGHASLDAALHVRRRLV